MTGTLAFGILAITLAVLSFSYFILQPELAKLRSEEIREEETQAGQVQKAKETPVFDLIEKVMDRFGLRGFSADQLSQAGIKSDPMSMVAITLLVAMAMFLFGQVVFQNFFFSLIIAVFSPFLVKSWIGMKTAKRKEKFNEQMAESMTLLSSALKSGMNVPTALASTATEMEAPMGEELARVVNESRLGRDLVHAMRETAGRMESDDFMWVTEAVAIQRESGGRLSEILDRVTETIAERNELRLKIAALAAEGKASAVILMALPVFIGVIFAVMNPGFMAPLFNSSTGWLLLGISGVFYAVGGFWLSRITKVRL